MLKLGRRLLIVVHRWIGIGAAVLFVMWFASGLVMLYVPFPALGERERLKGEDPIAWSQVRLDPKQAVSAAGEDWPARLRLTMLDGEPVYRLGGAGGTTVSAVDGRLIEGVDARRAARIAGRFAHYAGSARVVVIGRDQWTVGGDYAADAPLYRVSLADPARTDLYVSSTTGEVVLDTTRRERLWSRVGTVPHWLYFTVLRQNPSLWTKVVLWASGLGIVGAVTGLWDGILRLRLRRRYPGGRVSPYRGWMKWHHVGGLVSGIAVVTWIVSGWLSMNPNGWFAGSGPDQAALAHYAGPGTPIAVDLARIHPPPGIREARFVWAAGRPVTVLTDADLGRTVLDPANGQTVRPDRNGLFERAGMLVPGAHVTARQVLTAEDVYWYGVRSPARLPVLRVKFDDPARTWFHIDATTGEAVGMLTAEDRAGRWAFNFLHDFDLPILLRSRPSWDLLIWTLSAGGLVISVSALVIGWRRLGRKVLEARLWERRRRRLRRA